MINDNIDLTKILKDCPIGWKFYSSVYGDVEFLGVSHCCPVPLHGQDDELFLTDDFMRKKYPIRIKSRFGEYDVSHEGKLRVGAGECTLFPSRDQRDWSKFTAPWYNLEKQGEDKKEINNFDVLPGLYKCIHRMFDGTPDGRLLFEIGNVYKCLSKHDRAEFEVSYGHSVYLEDPVVCKYFIPFESKEEQAPSQTNERAWLYLVAEVLTWQDGIRRDLDDPRVQELAKRLCSKYAQKLYNPLVLYNSLNTEKNEQKPADKIEPKFKVGDWIISSVLGIAHIIGVNDSNEYQLEYIDGKQKFSSIDYVNYEYDKWTINDAKDGDVVQLGLVIAIFKKYIGGEKCICYCSFCKNVGFEIPIENGEDNVYGCYNAIPATKEQHDTLMKAMNDTGYEWDIKKKELKKLVPNRFDPNTLRPFDKVLVRDSDNESWCCDLFSHIREENIGYKYVASGFFLYRCCIPYNEETKHLVGTTDEPTGYYRYWEN